MEIKADFYIRKILSILSFVFYDKANLKDKYVGLTIS